MTKENTSFFKIVIYVNFSKNKIQTERKLESMNVEYHINYTSCCLL